MSVYLPPKFCSNPRTTLSPSALHRAIIEKAFLSLPEELIDVILRRYVEYVHAQFPVIDINALCQGLEPNREVQKPSILLWQALTTAVIPFLTDSELGRAGLISGDAASETFAYRTKVPALPAHFFF